MTWFLALLYFVSGLVAGTLGVFYLGAWILIHDATRRLEFLRNFATRWPETFERAMLDVQVMRGDEDEETLTLEPIEFKLCDHCHLPWPTDEDDKLIRHPAVNVRPYTGGNGSIECGGSGTKDYRGEV